MVEHTQAVFPLMRGREGLLRWSERRRCDAPFYAALVRAIAEEDDLLALSEETAPGQLSGRMMLSAIHYLLLNDPDQPLAAYFPTLTPTPLPFDEVTPVLTDFCRAHHDKIAAILRSRTLQTTGTDRAGRVLLALDTVAKVIDGPFSLVEVGCSAGLLMLFDHYRYEFGEGESLGPEDAATVVTAFDFGARRPAMPIAFPAITHRVGLDLHPVDVADPDERNWILGCVVADRVPEFTAVRRSLDYRAGVPLETVTGDALDTLPRVLATIEGSVCVLHSWCLYQWPVAAQDAFDAMLKRLSLARPIHRVGLETTEQSAAASTLEVSHTIYQDGAVETRLLGRVRDSAKIEWLV